MSSDRDRLSRISALLALASVSGTACIEEPRERRQSYTPSLHYWPKYEPKEPPAPTPEQERKMSARAERARRTEEGKQKKGTAE